MIIKVKNYSIVEKEIVCMRKYFVTYLLKIILFFFVFAKTKLNKKSVFRFVFDFDRIFKIKTKVTQPKTILSVAFLSIF